MANGRSTLASGASPQRMVNDGTYQPDEDSGADGATVEPSDADVARASFYGLLARLLEEPPSAQLLSQVADIEGDDTVIGEQLQRLAKLAGATSPEDAEDEFTLLFYGKGDGGELLPYGSYYRTGILHDKPLAELRGSMKELGIQRGDLNKEPEDHIAFVLEMMHGLITGSFGVGVAGLDQQTTFYQQHLAPWAIDFFEDLEAAKSATLFAAVAGLGRVFLHIEEDAFQMAA